MDTILLTLAFVAAASLGGFALFLWRGRARLQDELERRSATEAEQELSWGVLDALDAAGVIVDALDTAVMIVDRTGRVLRSNAASERLLNLPGKPTGENLGRLLKGSKGLEGDELERALESASPRNFALEWFGEGTQDRRLMLTLRPLTSSDGALIVSLQDVGTLESRVRDELPKEELHTYKMEAIGTLASGVAHDVNNLLTAIFGYTALARQCLDPDHQAGEPLRMVEEAARRTMKVIRGLLSLSHNTPGRKHVVDVAALVSESARLMRRVMPSSIQLEEVSSELPAVWVLGDPVQLQQVLLSMAINARDAMPEGGKLRIGLSAPASDGQGADGAEATITVEDSGTLLDRAERERGFAAYFPIPSSISKVRHGLAPIARIIEGHAGRIEIETSSRGGRYLVHLPLCAAPDSTETKRQSSGERLSGELVLLAGDDVYVRSLMDSSLRAAGYRVAQSGDIAGALQTFEEIEKDLSLVIADGDMPGGNGLSCLRVMRKTRPGLPAIIATGDLEFDLPEEEVESTVILRKPFQMSELVDLASKLSGSRSQPQEV